MKLLSPPDALLEGIIRFVCVCVWFCPQLIWHIPGPIHLLFCVRFYERLLKDILWLRWFTIFGNLFYWLPWLLLSSWSSTPSVCPQRHKVDICTLLTENHTVYPLKANFRVHLSSSRCGPVSWDVVPTTVSDFQLFCQPQSRFSISFSLYQAGLAWLMILTLFFHGTVRFVRFDGQKTPWAATVSKPVAQSTAPTLFSNLNNSIYAIATIHVSAMKPKNGSKKHSNIIWRSYWLLHLHALPLPYKIKQW